MISALIVIARLTGYLIAVWLITVGGNKVCKLVLNAAGVRPNTASTSARSPLGETQTGETSSQPNAENITAGRFIGGLERTIIVLGLIAGSWEVVGSVIALKSVARFRNLITSLRQNIF